jgi:hypothetical protein
MEQDTRILDAIGREFSQRSGRRVSQRLKELAVSALHKGHTATEIARAAGVSSQSVVNWKKTSDGVSAPKSRLPIELKVVEERVLLDKAVEERLSIVRILLRSGAVVEVVASSLDPSWLIALNGGEP